MPEQKTRIQIPQTQFYQFLDRFTSMDEILRKQTELLSIIAGKEVLIPPPADIPLTVEDKLSRLVELSGETNRLLRGTENIVHDHTTMTSANKEKELTSLSQVSRSVLIKARDSNSGTVYLGAKGVNTNNGYPLTSGKSISLDHNHSKNPIYLFADTANDEVEYIIIW